MKHNFGHQESQPSSYLRSSKALLPALFLLLFLTSLTAQAGAQECARPESIENAWEMTAPRATQMPAEPGEPEVLAEKVTGPVEGLPGELHSEARLHALFRTEIGAFEAALRKIEEQPEFLPRLAETEVLCSTGEPRSYAEVRQRLSFRFLFFSRDYEYVLHYFLENPGSDRFVVWWVLKEPLDGQILTTEGSWYFERVTLGGEEYTYMAYTTRTAFDRERLGLRAALERFGARDARQAMLALNEEARRSAE